MPSGPKPLCLQNSGPLWNPQDPLTSILSHLWRGERDERIHIVLIHHREQCPAHQTPCRRNITMYKKKTEAQRMQAYPVAKSPTACK